MYATEHQAALLRAAVEEIKKHPETFDMGMWCGSVCCLAGHIVKKAVSEREWDWLCRNVWPVPSIAARAGAILQTHNVLNLFLTDDWPPRFLEGVVNDSPTPEQLEARVEHWINTGE